MQPKCLTGCSLLLWQRQLTSLEHIFCPMNKCDEVPVLPWAVLLPAAAVCITWLSGFITYLCICLYRSMDVSTYTRHIWMHIDLYVCIYVYLCIYASVGICLCVQQGRQFRAMRLVLLWQRGSTCHGWDLEMNDTPAQCKVVPLLSSDCFWFYFINHLLLTWGGDAADEYMLNNLQAFFFPCGFCCWWWWWLGFFNRTNKT